ncbi:MAG: GNAT family N-acetyltransferase [Bacteroidia bacterium]|nr:GNAT family N-acetyltransferase [Bacteroidia bacterium]
MAIRFITEKDYASLISFFKISFNINYSIEEFTNRYSNCNSKLSMMYEIDSTNEIAAFLGVFIEKGLINNKRVMVCQFADGLTNPKYRGKGYFKNLALRVYEECKNNGCSFIFGFPNKNAFPVWKKLGWIFKENMHKVNFYIPTYPLSLIYNKSYWPAMKIFRLFKKFESTSESLNLFNTSEYNENSIIHDSEFFKRKICYNKRIIKINNIMMIVKFNKSLQVGLISEISDYKIFLKILRKLKILCLYSGIIRLDFILHPNNYLLQFFNNKKIISKPSVPIGYWDISESNGFDGVNFSLIDFDTY